MRYADLRDLDEDVYQVLVESLIEQKLLRRAGDDDADVTEGDE